MKITENVTMLELKRDRGALYPVVIRDEGSCVLVDAGFPMMMDELWRALLADGIKAEELTGIILTHQDIDHIGCVKEALERAPGCAVYAHGLEAPYIDGRKTPQKLAAFEARAQTEQEKAALENMRAGFSNRRIPIDRCLNDGEELPLAGGVQVIHTPGHTDGHICLLVKADGVLVAGDLLHIKDGALAGPNLQHTPDMPLALLSVKKLMGRGITAVASYHGGLFTGDVEAALADITAGRE